MPAGRVAWLLVGAALFVAPAAHADERTEARSHFKKGMAAIVDGRYEAGIDELKKAYDILPHPNVLYNIARAYVDVGDLEDAIANYRRYLESNPPDRDEVERTISSLDARQRKQQAQLFDVQAPAPPAGDPAPPAIVGCPTASLRRPRRPLRPPPRSRGNLRPSRRRSRTRAPSAGVDVLARRRRPRRVPRPPRRRSTPGRSRRRPSSRRRSSRRRRRRRTRSTRRTRRRSSPSKTSAFRASPRSRSSCGASRAWT